MDQKRKPRIKAGQVASVLIFGLVLLYIILRLTGVIIFIETLRLPGEVRGYIGRNSKILENVDQMEKIFIELENRPEFKGKEIQLASLSIDNHYVNVTVQNPNNPAYFDRYRYVGNSLFYPRWQELGADKFGSGMNDLFSLAEIDANGLYKFNANIENFLEEYDIEPEDERISIRFQHTGPNNEYLYQRSHISGERDDFTFEADLSGNLFEYEDRLGVINSQQSYINHSPEAIADLLDQLKEVEDLKGKEILLYTFRVNGNHAYAQVQNPLVLSESISFHYYRNNMIHNSWEKSDTSTVSLDSDLGGRDLININDIDAQAFHQHLLDIQKYISNNSLRHEIDEPEFILDSAAYISVEIRYIHSKDSLMIEGDTAGLQEDFSTEANLDGSNFQIVN